MIRYGSCTGLLIIVLQAGTSWAAHSMWAGCLGLNLGLRNEVSLQERLLVTPFSHSICSTVHVTLHVGAGSSAANTATYVFMSV